MLGQRLRELREKKGMLLREVAAHLEIDTAMISKIEREEKSCKREHIIKLAKLLDSSEQELTVLWLSDSIYPIVKDETFGIKALDQVKKRLKKLE
ncbi:MAG: helix-turn-helix transcriptional regulator [Flammeovirgaceae bacterium]|nr:helix-turn-helix transcriptional regulator [Flammeovirgaceae bacterium]